MSAQAVQNGDVHRAVAVLAALAAGAHGQAVDPNTVYAYRVLDNPTTGDAFMFRGAIQQNAQTMSDRLFQALSSILGGQAPSLNFTQTGSPLTPSDLSATRATNTVNINPLGTWALTDPRSPFHNAAVTYVPHEQAHLRQTPDVFSSLPQAEGGAQAFADLVAPVAAKRAGIAFGGGNYDGSYAPFVQQVQPLGREWILGTQFGHPAPSWP